MGVFVENIKATSFSVCLKDNVADFTKQLYYTLFDDVYQQENLIGVKKQFF